MNSLVVLFAVVAAALAAPRSEKRSIGHAVVYSVPAAVSHQSRVDVHSSPAVVATQYLAEPVVEARAVVPAATVYAAPAAVSHQSRVDVRSSPAVVAAAPVLAGPAVTEARSLYAAPAAAVYAAPAAAVYAAPAANVYAGGSAVTHQSRVDVETSPGVYTEQLFAPAVVDARSVLSPSLYASAW